MPKKKKRPQKAAAAAQPQQAQRWAALYEVAGRIIGLDPWVNFKDDDLLLYIPRDMKQTVFFHICSNDSMTGILIFPDAASYLNFSRDCSTTREISRLFIESCSYTMQLTPWDELDPETQRLLSKLGRRPDNGSSLVPVFFSKQYGCMPVPSKSRRDLDFLIDCMRNLYMQLCAVLQGGLVVDFDGGEMLVRFYSSENRLWLNRAMPKKLPEPERAPVLLVDTAPIEHLRSCPVNPDGLRVEFDFSWSWDEEAEEDGKAFYYPIIAVFTDRVHKTVLTASRCHPSQLVDCAFSLWEDLIVQHGRPDTLYVSRDESFDLFEDFANKLGVKIKRVKHLPAAERALREYGAV